ncbi:hypothetical protein E2C01_086334 [Portunus trituberculatus]|uniref:Uncharacterized protein n=1 Tax=Portunus trituberculatus TaxID=210409 RepID=A0A5B7JD63_PORTR|nr:hypothetical protein [Portunus trituberculatus]
MRYEMVTTHTDWSRLLPKALTALASASLHLQVTPSTAMLCDPPASFCTHMPKCYADEIISR